MHAQEHNKNGLYIYIYINELAGAFVISIELHVMIEMILYYL